MSNSRSRNSGKMNRVIAFCFTMIFHLSLIGGLYYTSNSESSIKDWLPETIQTWFDSEDKKSSEEEKDQA